MSFWNRFKRVQDTVGVEPGQISIPDENLASGIGRLTSFYGIKTPKFPLEYLTILELLSIWNPDISQALSIIVNLGNTGHEIKVDDKSPDAVLDRINGLASKIYRTGGGTDGLVNHFLRQISLMGALSAEWVVADNVQDGVKDVVIVPVRSIRFKREDGVFQPYQYTGGAFDAAYIKLNPLSYSYNPIQTMDDDPYGIPGFYAALKNIEIQLDSVGGIGQIVRKMGLLGFLDVSLKIPEKNTGESDPAYRSRLGTRLKDYAKAFTANFSRGVAVHYEDQALKHNNVGSTAAAGAKSVFNLNEEQILSALDIPPSMMGRSYSTTETYASVDFERLTKRLLNCRRTTKRFLEKGYNLDLALSGIDARVSVKFNGNSGFQEKESADAEGQRIKNVTAKRDAGFISDDEAARELGYDEATGQRQPDRDLDPALTFKFDRENNRYEFVRPSLPQIFTFAKDTGKRVQNYAEAIRSILDPGEAKAIKAAIKAAGQKYANETAFAKGVFKAFDKELLKHLKKSNANKVSDKYVKEAWQFFRHEDNSDMPKKQSRQRFGININLADTNAIRYLTSIDRFFFGSGNYLTKNKVVGTKFINWLENEYITKGLNIRDEKTMQAFSKEFSGMVKTTTWDKINQLVNTTMARVQNFGQTMKLYEAGFKRFRIVGPKTAPICSFCSNMVGRVFEVEKAAKRLSKIVSKGFEDVSDLPSFITNEYSPDELEKLSDKQLQDAGFESPPYHPECRHRKAAED
ncbi:MAG: hypothetical protein GY710_12075 [Desulfobacteraceae bacterium]|nr:hypothetical protein [Desulfobacteraceae bacterium]